MPSRDSRKTFIPRENQGIFRGLFATLTRTAPDEQKFAQTLKFLVAAERNHDLTTVFRTRFDFDSSPQCHAKLLLQRLNLAVPVLSSLFGVASPMGLLVGNSVACLLYTSPSPRDLSTSRMPSSA